MAAPAPSGGGAQIVQQIEGLLAQLAQMEPEPDIQRLIQAAQQPLEALQQVVGKDDMQDMQSGLAGGAGGAPPPGEEGGGMPPPGPPGGGAPMGAGEPGGGAPGGAPGEHHTIEIAIHPGGPKDFKSANKAAMSTLGARGHFDRGTPAGEEPKTQKAKSKAKG